MWVRKDPAKFPAEFPSRKLEVIYRRAFAGAQGETMLPNSQVLEVHVRTRAHPWTCMPTCHVTIPVLCCNLRESHQQCAN